MAALTPEQADVYQCYLYGYSATTGAIALVESSPSDSVERDIALALGAYDGKSGASPRWSGTLLANVRHMKDPAAGAGGAVGG